GPRWRILCRGSRPEVCPPNSILRRGLLLSSQDGKTATLDNTGALWVGDQSPQALPPAGIPETTATTPATTNVAVDPRAAACGSAMRTPSASTPLRGNYFY